MTIDEALQPQEQTAKQPMTIEQALGDSGSMTGPNYSGGGGPGSAPPELHTGETLKGDLKMAGAVGLGLALPYAAGAGAVALGGGTTAGILAEMGGQGLATWLRQKLYGQPTNLKEIGGDMALTGGIGGVTKLLAHSSGSLGGVRPQFTEYAGKKGPAGYRVTMGTPSTEAELSLGESMNAPGMSAGMPTGETVGRATTRSILQSASQPGQTKISIQPIIDKLQSHIIPAAAEPSAISYNDKLSTFIDNLDAIEANGGMTPVELDALINKQINPKSFTNTGDPANNTLGGTYRDTGGTARPTLMAGLPPEARASVASTAKELSARETANEFFGANKGAQAVSNNLKTLYQPGHEEALRTLKKISADTGIDWEKMAHDLATKRAFSSDDRQLAPIIGRITEVLGIGALAHGNVGVAAGAMISNPVVSRNIARIIAPLQLVSGPGGTTMLNYLTKKYSYRQKPQASQEPAQHSWIETPFDKQAFQ